MLAPRAEAAASWRGRRATRGELPRHLPTCSFPRTSHILSNRLVRLTAFGNLASEIWSNEFIQPPATRKRCFGRCSLPSCRLVRSSERHLDFFKDIKKGVDFNFFSLNKVSAAALKSPVGAVSGGRGIQISAVLKTRQVSEQVMGSQKSQGARGCRNPPRTAQQFRRLCCCVLQDFFLKKEKNRYLPCSNSQFPFLRLQAPFSP